MIPLPSRRRRAGRRTVMHQVRSRLRSRTGEDLGLRCPADTGRPRNHDGSPRDSAFYQQFLQQVENANPAGDVYVVTDNLSSHNSKSPREWLEDHPRIRHVFIPVGACRLDLQEGSWRIFRKTALAGQSFAGPPETDQGTCLATTQLNTRARPWIRGGPSPPNRHLRRRYVYTVRAIEHQVVS
ncbi:transposase [Streptomyces noursei]|uniref:transposase n=1 Tax=Streptomyces noursei TaxID=1971 RepID=UPI001352076D